MIYLVKFSRRHLRKKERGGRGGRRRESRAQISLPLLFLSCSYVGREEEERVGRWKKKKNFSVRCCAPPKKQGHQNRFLRMQNRFIYLLPKVSEDRKRLQKTNTLDMHKIARMAPRSTFIAPKFHTANAKGGQE